MKRIIIVLSLALAGCSFDVPEYVPEYVPDPIPAITFEQASQPYLDLYGYPEEINRYDSGSYHMVDWWYWSIGFEVSFIDSPYDDTNGWKVDSTYTFAPIY